MINIDAEIYSEFTCKADKCKHSCCRGWEIDIDEDTLKYYKGLDLELGCEIRQNIDWGEEPFFKLTPDERCPFLKDSGLCKIIEELGEEGLCDICRLHPRFFESVNDHNLAGVGLSCEKAAELLFEKDSLNFMICESGKKISFEELLELIGIDVPQDYLSLAKVIPDHLEAAKIERILDIFYDTEPIDDNWKNEVAQLKESYKEQLDELAAGEALMRFRVIYQYIIFRQLELVQEYGVPKIVEYAVRSIIFIMLYAGIFGDDPEAVRRWSEQIEYNEDNVVKVVEA